MKADAKPAAAPADADPTRGALRVLREQSLNTLVRQEIERQIVSGTLAAGAKLNEMDFSSALGVSRGPVREAFRALEQAGLVRTEKNRGVFVREISLEEADEIYEVRAALEGMIGRLAAQRRTAAQLAGLRALLKRMRAVSREREADAYLPLNLEFHDALAEAAGNAALAANYRRVANELKLLRREMLRHDAENITRSTREHEAIVEAIAAADADTASRLLLEHALGSRDRLHRAREARAVGRAA
jgi:phosphonate utilization transcriptional regulator